MSRFRADVRAAVIGWLDSLPPRADRFIHSLVEQNGESPGTERLKPTGNCQNGMTQRSMLSPRVTAQIPGLIPPRITQAPFSTLRHPKDSTVLFLPEGKNCNVNGLVHGGVLMTFADFSLCMAATDHYREESCSTISFSSAFVSAASRGELIRCLPKVTKKTGSMVFVSGELESCGDVVMTFSAVVKRLRDK